MGWGCGLRGRRLVVGWFGVHMSGRLGGAGRKTREGGYPGGWGLHCMIIGRFVRALLNCIISCIFTFFFILYSSLSPLAPVPRLSFLFMTCMQLPFKSSFLSYYTYTFSPPPSRLPFITSGLPFLSPSLSTHHHLSLQSISLPSPQTTLPPAIRTPHPPQRPRNK